MISMGLNREKPLVKESSLLIHFPSNSQLLQEVTKETGARINTYEQFAKGIADTGSTDGTNGVPDEHSTNSYAENTILNEHDATLNEVSHTIYVARTHLNQMKVKISATLEDSSIEKEQQDRNLLRKRVALNEVNQGIPRSNFNKKIKTLLQKTGSIPGVITLFKEQLQQLEEKKLYADGRFQQMRVHSYNNMPPRKRWIDYRFVFLGVIFTLFSAEYFANFTAFQTINLGGSNIGSLLFGLLATAAQAFYAERLGSAIGDKNRRLIILFTLTTFTICFAVCTPRLLMPGDSLLKVFYLLFNFAIAGTTILLAYSHAKHSKFFDEQRERDRLAMRITYLKQRIEQLEANYEEKIEEVEERYRIEMDQSIQAAKAGWQKQIDQTNSELSRLDSLQSKYTKHLDKIRLSALERYCHLNSDARKHKGHPPVKRWQDYQAKGADDFSMIKKISIVLLFFSFGLASCGKQDQATSMEVLYDQTDGIKATVNTAQMADYIIGYVEEDISDDAWGRFEVTLSRIGETSTQPPLTVTLPASEPYWSRNENETWQQPERFRQELKVALDSLTQPTPKMNHSYIHRNFYYRLQELAPKRGRKIILSWSDLILNDPPVNFYLYEKTPGKILEQKDLLIKLMTKDYPIESLSGIELINFYQPSTSNDALHEVAKKYFRYYWEKLGMKVEFRSAPPATTAVLNEQKQ